MMFALGVAALLAMFTGVLTYTFTATPRGERVSEILLGVGALCLLLPAAVQLVEEGIQAFKAHQPAGVIAYTLLANAALCATLAMVTYLRRNQIRAHSEARYRRLLTTLTIAGLVSGGLALFMLFVWPRVGG